jgi:acylphosphatase
MATGLRCIVTGRVQGVGFRAATQQAALRLELRGYACNLDDGRVEVLAIGSPDALEQLAHWLAHGPPLARVDAVERHAIATPEAVTGFAIR